MPIILKAKNIYETPKSIKYNSPVDSVKLIATDWKGKIGRISPIYQNIYFEKDKNGNLQFVGTNAKKDFPIDTEGIIETTLYADFRNNAVFDIEQIIDIIPDDLSGSQDYALVREINWQKPRDSLLEWYDKQTYLGALKYDESTNTFSADLDTYDSNDNILKTLDISDVFRLDESFYVSGRYREKTSKTYYNKESNREETNTLSLPENELVSANHYYYGFSAPGIWAQKVVDTVYGIYKNGKEVYSIKCAISNYYDENGQLVVSVDEEKLPCLIPKHTIVIPYIFSTLGEVPLATKKDGTPKEFEVIGQDFEFKGVPWQILTIQEYV